MSLRTVVAVQLGAMVVAASAQAEGGKVYSGTFKDAAGHAGPMQCELVAKDGGKWTANFSGKNTGDGPKKAYQYAVEMSGKEEGSKLNLTADYDMKRQGMYEVAAVLAEQSLKATFKKKDGGGAGSFDLTLGKAEAAPAETAPKKEEPAPAPKVPDVQPK
jgi:hypothetical protein